MACIVNISFARSGLHQLGAHAGQGPALQPRDVHLGVADLGRNLVLIQVVEEPQHDHLPLSSGRAATSPGGPTDSLAPPWLRARHPVAQATVGVVADGLVQRHLETAAGGRQCLQDLLLTQLQLLGQLGCGGGAAQALMKLLGPPGTAARVVP